ncbi:MAG TPA: EF-P beta-lysylation protein EpmB [Gammaproteobacteria bacterium]|nr:EF-P beta-lysylation protein EpmB [Gammaproteobacteria bacterium]
MTSQAKKIWQQELAGSVKTPDMLASILQLLPEQQVAIKSAHQSFSVRVPLAWIERINKGDSNDPLLRQILPHADELRYVPGFTDDPLAESASMPSRGVLHKYHGRALLIASPACAIHCRYCFRRHFPYQEVTPTTEQWQQAFSYLESNVDISEVILSGGDPLTLNNERLFRLMQRLEKIPHVRRLRLHTRTPVALPSRVDQEFIEKLSQLQKKIKTVVVLHVNHANEIDCDVSDAICRIKKTGITLLNQTVLLRNVNDSVEALENLSEKLFSIDVLPYYLHLLDKVQGAAHFEVDKAEAIDLVMTLREKLPGYLVPKLVQEGAGEPFKTMIDLSVAKA